MEDPIVKFYYKLVIKRLTPRQVSELVSMLRNLYGINNEVNKENGEHENDLYDQNKAFIDAIKAVKDSFMERTEVEKEKAKPDDIHAGDGSIVHALRKLVMTANNIIGWFVDQLTTDFI